MLSCHKGQFAECFLHLSRYMSAVVEEDASTQEGKSEVLANLVITALRDGGWGCVSAADVKVENKSAHGVGECFKVSAENADPPVVALHKFGNLSAYVLDSDFMGRMADAAKVFWDGHLGPRRLAHGRDWFIEVWEGNGQPDFESVDKFKELGKLVADVHKLPTEWFDTWREKACERRPELRDIPHGSHAWWYFCARGGTFPEDEECLQFWLKGEPCFAPSSSALRRLVTTHGDCKPDNLIETDSGMRLLDFEITTVSSAAFDVGWVFMWAGTGPEAKKNKLAFLEEYMASSGLSTDVENVEKAYVDAEIYKMVMPWGNLWPAVSENNKQRMYFLESLILKAREDREIVKQILDEGIDAAMKFLETEAD